MLFNIGYRKELSLVEFWHSPRGWDDKNIDIWIIFYSRFQNVTKLVILLYIEDNSHGHGIHGLQYIEWTTWMTSNSREQSRSAVIG